MFGNVSPLTSFDDAQKNNVMYYSLIVLVTVAQLANFYLENARNFFVLISTQFCSATRRRAPTHILPSAARTPRRDWRTWISATTVKTDYRPNQRDAHLRATGQVGENSLGIAQQRFGVEFAAVP